jgi:ATP-dependent RNA helicase RhlE
MTFDSLNLPSEVNEAIKSIGYTIPTPIQAKSIPPLMAGRDLIGSAQTGTGKTAAFGIPIIAALRTHAPRGPRVLILTPTRELAAQVEESMKMLAQKTNLRIASVIGGVGYGKQRDDLKRGLDILIATPGRLLDHMTQRTCSLGGVTHLVMDEADRMLDMGFMPSVRKILQSIPPKRQTALFSATIPPEIQQLAKWALKDPEVIAIGPKRAPAANVKHVVYPVSSDQKFELLKALLEKAEYRSVIIFTRTRRGADKLATLLKRENHGVAVMHSDRSQREREKALDAFRDDRVELLVATDLAARGLDIPQVSHVVNWDVPEHPEDYVHRVGRTGRADATGDAFTLLTAGEVKHLAAIERFINMKIDQVKLEGFDYKYTALFERKGGERGAPRPTRYVGVRLSGGYYFGNAKKKR